MTRPMKRTRWGRLAWVSTRVQGKQYIYTLKCDCGRTIERTAQALHSMRCLSCGCLRRELDRAIRDARIKAHEEAFRKEDTKPAKR